MNGELVTAIADLAALVAFAAAFVVALRLRMRHIGAEYARMVRMFLAIALGVYVFVSFSNVLEHLGVTAALDDYEDYAELLFVPFLVYAAYTGSIALRMREIQEAERRARAEHALLATVLGTSPGGMMAISTRGEITFANEKARALLGLTEPSEPEGWRFPHGFECGADSPAGQSISVDQLSAGATFSDVLCHVRVGDRTASLSVSAAPLVGEDGQTLGSVVTFVDVTEREQARRDLIDAQGRYNRDLERTVDERTAELLDLNAQLVEANEVKHQLLANVSHELRTPLNIIIGFTDVLASGLAGPVTEEQSRQLAMIKESSTQLLAMVNDLLDMERIQGGHAIAVPEPVALDQMLEALVSLMRPLADERALTLTLSVPGHMTVVTDPDLLAQVVRNLLSNAIKFTHPGGRVHVEAAVLGDRFTVSVTDDGIGIAEKDIPRVFEAFAQVRGDRRGKPQGTGLGLAICKDVAALLGGTVSVVSTPGTGSTFEVELPQELRTEQS
ncbi:MAG: PAS domain-containing sensor histidine kinase [Actinomycetia bacterium]|nr:PAS domain-containing sensor histidine kinase [Actinomycetes bacterium]